MSDFKNDVSDVVVAIFQRKNGKSAATRLWIDWDETTREKLSGRAVIGENERPLILSVSTSGYCLLTTCRLVTEHWSASLRDVVGVRSVGFGSVNKGQLSDLSVEHRSGEQLELSMETGKSYFAIWQILLFLAQNNRKGLDRGN